MNYFKLGDKVTCSDLYDHKEVFEVVGLRLDSVEIRGDFSGGTHNVSQTDWVALDTVRYADFSEISNSRKGSKHWYITLLSTISHVGEYMLDQPLTEEQRLNWGEWLKKRSRELMDNYKAIQNYKED